MDLLEVIVFVGITSILVGETIDNYVLIDFPSFNANTNSSKFDTHNAIMTSTPLNSLMVTFSAMST
jgi:hypothetical protein